MVVAKVEIRLSLVITILCICWKESVINFNNGSCIYLAFNSLVGQNLLKNCLIDPYRNFQDSHMRLGTLILCTNLKHICYSFIFLRVLHLLFTHIYLYTYALVRMNPN